MAKDASIFGLRFGSNAELNPTHDELARFLADTKNAGGWEPQSGDLERYRGLIDHIREFPHTRRFEEETQDIRDRMFYGVLGLSQFAHPGLELSIGQFKYHLRLLASLDFRKPSAFIRTAEQEMAGLNPKKKEDAAKLARLHGMVEERKQALTVLRKRRADLARELVHIARYVADNLVRIEHLCEASIAILAGILVSQQEEKRLIEDVKEHFRNQLKDSLLRGPISPQQLEEAKQDVAILSRELSALIREDIYAMTSLYEAILEHTRRFAGEIGGLLARQAHGRDDSGEEDLKLFMELERTLVALIADLRFDLTAAALRSETAHADLLREKRRDMLDRIFAQLEKERRARSDRRSGEERRQQQPPAPLAPERRGGEDRRSGKSRRR